MVAVDSKSIPEKQNVSLSLSKDSEDKLNTELFSEIFSTQGINNETSSQDTNEKIHIETNTKNSIDETKQNQHNNKELNNNINPSNTSDKYKEKTEELKFDEKILNRQLNVGFSGGEKKKNEILQMSILNPKLSILDETDSGLDIDALRIVSEGVNSLRNKNNSFLIITHYQRLLDYIKPDFVHVLKNGQIIKSGDFELAKELEKVGYKDFN